MDMSTSLERSLGALFAPRRHVSRKPAAPVVEYHVHDDDRYACMPAYHGTDRARAERVAAGLTNPEIVEVPR